MKLSHPKFMIKEEIEKIIPPQKLLIPRRSPEERAKNFNFITHQKIQKYIENGSKGDLYLDNTPITSLPSNLKVGGSLYVSNTFISKTTTKEKIKQNYPGIKGYVYIYNKNGTINKTYKRRNNVG